MKKKAAKAVKKGPPKKAGRVAPKAPEKPFRLVVGREYVSRSGERSGKLTRTPGISDKSHPFHSKLLMRTYRPDGGWWFHGESDHDLVREVPDAKRPEAKPRGKKAVKKGRG